MENDIKKWWLSMSEGRLRNHLLIKVRLPSSIVEGVVAKVQELKKEQRNARIKQGRGVSLWDEFLEAPRHEASIIRVLKTQLKKQDGEGTARWHALCAYADVISSVIEKLKTEAKVRGATPLKLPALLHADGYTLPRNNGEHWTDYVKNSDLLRIRNLFNSLPPPARGRHKAPFERTLPPSAYKKRKAAVFTRLQSEQESAERALEVAQAPEDVDKLTALLDKMQEAQYLLHNHKRNTPLPATWHGLLK